MPSHTRRGAFGTTVGVGFVLNPRDCFVLAGVERRILLLLSINPWYADRFVLAGVVRRIDLSVGDSIKLGGVLLALAVGAVGEMSCGITDCSSQLVQRSACFSE